MDYKKFETDLFGRKLKVEIGRVAEQANGSALVTYGETVVLATATMGNEPREVDYLPLSVEYEEKLYAAGKIKGSRFIKREGRPSEDSILTGRMIDRIIRPRFDQKIRQEIQVVLTVLSFDQKNDPDIPALLAASIALGVSDIPWNGPMSGLRIGHFADILRTKTDKSGHFTDILRTKADKSGHFADKSGQWILNPDYQSREQSDLELVIAGDGKKINMLEGLSRQVKENVLSEAIEFSLPYIKQNIQFQQEIIDAINPQKQEPKIKYLPEKLLDKIKDWLAEKLEKAIYQPSKEEYRKEMDKLKNDLLAEFVSEDSPEDKIMEVFEEEIDHTVHQNILKKEKRPDGRKLDEVRPIKTEVGILPRTHGSALFRRGETQALSVVTLGPPGDEQLIEGLEPDVKKHFMHHYGFPPYCTGETGRMNGPGRREIGHGALAEKALFSLIPNKEDFPYTIRLVSEILSSNGSSSMASISGSSLALMDAGIPIKRHISGVAMGLMMNSDDDYKILTDIQGPEDHYGDMDCKVAGTEKGVTAVQMDVKIEGVSLEILKKVFSQAKEGRSYILDEMNKTIKEPRESLSPFAPRVFTLKINPDKIGIVIGPGGKMINEIINQTGVKIDVEDDGLVNISSDNEESAEKALEWVKNLTREVKPGEIFQGKVVKITDFGAFVEIIVGQEGLVHISELAPYRVEKVEDVVKTGQIVTVKVKNIDQSGRISLTMKNIDSPYPYSKKE